MVCAPQVVDGSLLPRFAWILPDLRVEHVEKDTFNVNEKMLQYYYHSVRIFGFDVGTHVNSSVIIYIFLTTF